MKVTRRGFLRAGASAPVFLAVAADVGTTQMPTKAAVEGYLSIHGRMEMTHLAFWDAEQREFEAHLDAGLRELRGHFLQQYRAVNERRRRTR